MEKDDILKDYGSQLSLTEEHLSRAGLSAYLNGFTHLSKKEKEFVAAHLLRCEDCAGRFAEVFDTELEFSPEPSVLLLHRLPGTTSEQAMRFSNEGGHVVALVREDEVGHQLTFERLPSDIERKNIMVSSNQAPLVRIVGATSRLPYSIPGAEPGQYTQEIKLQIFGDVAEQKGISVYWKYSIAAIILIALLTVITIWTRQTDQPEQALESERGHPSPPPPFADALDPERFTTNTVLEGFIDRTVRSEVHGRILSPVNGDTLSVPFLIQCEGDAGKYTLVLVDNRNSPVWQLVTSVRTATVADSIIPGLYYLKLQVDGKLLQVMKIAVLPKN